MKKSRGWRGDISLDDSFTEVAKKVLNTNMNALTETYSLLDENSFFQAIDALHQAKRIYFFGVGASLLTALKAMNKFLRIEPKVYCVQDSHIAGYGSLDDGTGGCGNGIFLFWCNEGYHSCGRTGKTGGSEDNLPDQVCEISVDVIL